MKDTGKHVSAEAANSVVPLLERPFLDTSLRHRVLGSVTQAGLVNNLNDGMLWGLLPVLLATQGFGTSSVGADGTASACTGDAIISTTRPAAIRERIAIAQRITADVRY